MNSLNLPGLLAMANAASYAKGQELTQDASTEAKERLRAARQRVVSRKAVDNQQKTQETTKGFLA